MQRHDVWHNKPMVDWNVVGKLSDGNGIILDLIDGDEAGAIAPDGNVIVAPSGETTTDKPKSAAWKGRTLVANNLSADNGGSGIHTFHTARVDIINNAP